MKKLIHKIQGNGSKTMLRRRFSIFIAAVAISLSFPFLFTRSGFLDFNGTGQIGDTIGGIVTPFIAIIAAWLTYTFFTRYRLIKNLPLDQADFGPRPSAVFEKEIREGRKEKVYLFEEHERADKRLLS